jgi:sulfate adenylyltransferase
MSRLVHPHGGGELKPLLLEGDALAAEKSRAASLPKLKMSSRETGDLIMLGIGGFTPLDGFMTKSDWQGVCDGYKMANGLFWPIPITLSTDDETIKEGDAIALVDGESGEIMGTMKVTDKYSIDKAHECMMVYKTTDLEHPGVKMVMAQGKYNLAGPVKVLSTGSFKEEYGDQFMTPAETRATFEKMGWSKIAAFQTRNPMHRSHEYSGEDRNRDHGRRAGPLAARRAEAGRHSRRGAFRSDQRAGRQLLRPQHRDPGRLPARHALCRPARGACCTRCSARTTAART